MLVAPKNVSEVSTVYTVLIHPDIEQSFSNKAEHTAIIFAVM